MQVARSLTVLELTRAAFAAGKLSFSKVRAISRVATAENEAELVELALQATAAQLERIVRGYRSAASADASRTAAVDRDRHLTWSWDEDGALVIRGRLPAEEGALLLCALEAARDGLAPDPEPEPDLDHDCGFVADRDVSAETPGPVRAARSNADALVAVADAALAAPDADRNGGDRYQVVVHTDAAALSDDPDGHAELEHGPALSSGTARRAACDAALITIAERDGRPLSVGRKTRTVPPALRRALRSRDWMHPTSLRRRAPHSPLGRRRPDQASNLVLLCRRHHRLLHEGGYSVDSP